MINLKSLILEGLADKEKFFKHHYTGFIGSNAYVQYEKPGGLAWLGHPSKYPLLLATKQHGPFKVEYRQNGEKNQYVKTDPNDDLKHVRDEHGELVFMTDAEIRAENLPVYDTLIVAFVGEKPVGHASNEFGAVGVWVEKEFQRVGIGSDLMILHLKQRPSVLFGKGKIGQMTDAGIAMTKKAYDKLEKEYGEDWFEKMRGHNDKS